MRVIIGVILCHVWYESLVYSHGIFGKNDSYHRVTKFLQLPAESKLKSIDFEEKWFVQPVDHFNPSDNRTWTQACINRFYELLIKRFKMW